MRQQKFTGKAFALLSVTAAILITSCCLGQTQARYENYSQWRAIYKPQQQVLHSDRLVSGGQTVLLQDWNVGSVASGMEAITITGKTGTTQGVLRCESDHPEYITAALDRSELVVDTTGTQVQLTMTPTQAALALTEQITVTVCVEFLPEGAEEPTLWADYQVVLLGTEPEEPVEAQSENPEESQPEETQPEETQPEETQPQETQTEETQPEETQPEETQTEETQPEETQPEETQTEETQPEEIQPEETQPQETQPEETQPQETQPEETQPEETQPQETQPEETQPEETQPEETQPEETQPEETQPQETQPEETQPAPAALSIDSADVFAWEEQLVLKITAPTSADTLILTMDDAHFPEGMRYTYNDETFLLGADMPIEIPMQSEEIQLFLDFSQLTQPQSGEISLQAQTLYQQEVTGIGEMTVETAREALQADLERFNPVLTGKNALNIPLCADTNGLTWRLEMLTETEEGIVYAQSDEQYYLVITISEESEETGSKKFINISNANGQAPAGTYRLTLERLQNEQVISRIQVPFFICY